MKSYTQKLILSSFFLLFSFTGHLNAQVISSGEIDRLVTNTMKTFDVPGIALAIVKDGKVIHSKGYGVRSLTSGEKTDEHTLFAIASNSKAFTAAALAILIDEGKLKWDDKVNYYIPEFKLYNPYVSDEFTIRDLLTHRSGLGLGAGDLMIWPGGAEFTTDEIIHNLRYLKPVSGFRTKFDYDNLLYIVAGEVIKRASGISWEEFIETRIMRPLGMTGSAASYTRIKDKSNVIDPHAPVNGGLKVIDRDISEPANAAGGIYSNIVDMCKWVNTQLNEGVIQNTGKQLFSKSQHSEMWSAQTILPVNTQPPYNSHFGAYGLGWLLTDVKGYKQVSHTGGLAGIVTQVTLIPEMKLGIIVLTNQQSGYAFTAITNTIKDRFLGIKGIDRIKQNEENFHSAQKEAMEVTQGIWKTIEEAQKNSSYNGENNVFTGTYNDHWFGDVVIKQEGNKLLFESQKSRRLTGEMLHYKGNTFIVKWDDRSLDADAFAMFTLDNEGTASGFKMKAISPLTDFSFDFHDLDLIRKK
ncbi:serine hydrolase [Arcticibacter tournemirensis]|uniref:Serine hydrolase n=1 Tax=Arcticibacter tournemirensis TaxID=699437 RepID=A0A4Q0MAC9_9SPHI|nr:serine hydrolase [Arcticibacter tournemirensis]RXF70210.1 serine hydrolase [Arcticibacter tournemirensis]